MSMVEWCNKFQCECYEVDTECPFWNEEEADTDCGECDDFEERDEDEFD